MAAEINWEDIVGDKTLENGGYVGDLMQVARAHIEDATTNNEITQAEAGQVYSAMIPSAFEHSIGFAMQEQIAEGNIDKLVAEVALSQQKIVGRRQAQGPTTVEEPGA